MGQWRRDTYIFLDEIGGFYHGQYSTGNADHASNEKPSTANAENGDTSRIYGVASRRGSIFDAKRKGNATAD